MIGGRLGDRYGKRRMFLIGIAGFTLASLACGLSAGPAMLVASRLVQGGFGALLIPQGIGILIGALSREQMRGAVSAFGPVMGASAVLGPIAAGFLISADIAGLTWRPIFLINIVLGSAGFVAALRLLPHDGPASAVPIDGLGSGLLGASMLGLIYGLIEGSTAGWTIGPVSCLVAGGVLLAGFGVRQRLAADPRSPDRLGGWRDGGWRPGGRHGRGGALGGRRLRRCSRRDIAPAAASTAAIKAGDAQTGNSSAAGALFHRRVPSRSAELPIGISQPGTSGFAVRRWWRRCEGRPTLKGISPCGAWDCHGPVDRPVAVPGLHFR